MAQAVLAPQPDPDGVIDRRRRSSAHDHERVYLDGHLVGLFPVGTSDEEIRWVARQQVLDAHARIAADQAYRQVIEQGHP